MATPSDPGMEGNSEVIHDGRSNADHEEEVKKAGGQDASGAGADENEEGDDKTPGESDEEDEKDGEDDDDE